jgi:hypothetical protein
MAAFNVKTITSNAKDISLVAPKAASKNKFCEIWPGTKTALELLQSIIKNPIAKGAIGIVIAAGEAVATKIC